MANSTSNSLSFPTADRDQRPLPEIIADGKPDETDHPGWLSFPLAYHDVDGKRYYSVQDWIVGVAQPDSHPGTFWTQMKKRLKKAGVELQTWCLKLRYTVSNGKSYLMDHATAEGLYIITQRMDAETPLRDRILRFLAKAGVILDDARVEPDSLLERIIAENPGKALEMVISTYRRMGKDDLWIATRLQGIDQRNAFTAAFQASMRVKPGRPHFGWITDTMRLGVWKRRTKTLKKEMGLNPKANLRDHMTALGLNYEMLAENLSAHILSQKTNLEYDQADKIVRSNSEVIGKQATQTSEFLGIDIATGHPLLNDRTP